MSDPVRDYQYGLKFTTDKLDKKSIQDIEDRINKFSISGNTLTFEVMPGTDTIQNISKAIAFDNCLISIVYEDKNGIKERGLIQIRMPSIIDFSTVDTIDLNESKVTPIRFIVKFKSKHIFPWQVEGC